MDKCIICGKLADTVPVKVRRRIILRPLCDTCILKHR